MNTDQNNNQTQSGLSIRPEQLSQDKNTGREETKQSLFGEVVYAYTRAQALEDGEQVEVSSTAREAGIRFPVFITRSAYDQYVAVPKKADGQDEAGRLWDVLSMMAFAIRSTKRESPRMPFQLHVRNDNRKPRLVSLVAECGPKDIDDPNPAITIMLPSED